MDTKLISIKHSNFFKTVAFILIVIIVTSSVLLLQDRVMREAEFESIFNPNYSESSAFLDGPAQIAMSEIINAREGINVDGLGENYYYYYEKNGEIFTNLKNSDIEFFTDYKGAVFNLKDGHWYYGKESYPYYVRYSYEEGKASIAFTSSYMNEKSNEWITQRNDLLICLANIGILVLIGLLLLIYITRVIGKTSKNSEVTESWIDRIPSDVFTLIYICFVALTLEFTYNLFYSYFFTTSNYSIFMVSVGVAVSIFMIISGFFYLSYVRRFKLKTLLKNSLCYKLLFAIMNYFKSLFDGRKFENNKLTKQLFIRQALFITLSATFVLFFFMLLYAPPLMFVPIIAELAMIYWFVNGNRKTFEEIDKGFNESFEEQMKAERLKIQLVTNVSHDLKTPLTSIISYADLLSKEECLDETARDYVNILIDKSNRLKNIVSDLFELAKSTSGDIQLEIETIDMKKLIEQTVADMDDEIQKSNLQFKVKLPEYPVLISADGRKIYRVLQNLIDNALKYTLEGTRVYIDLETVNHKAYISIKNIAGYEMSFTSEEILQRFARGDEARSTEGSGLGLSIAESFTEVCGGRFNLNVDGDLFKVTLVFNEVTK